MPPALSTLQHSRWLLSASELKMAPKRKCDWRRDFAWIANILRTPTAAVYFTRGSRHQRRTATVPPAPSTLQHSRWLLSALELKKMAPKRKCKFNEDWRRDFAWIAKLPNNGMAQCNLCATFRYHLVVAWMFAVTKRVHATLTWRREGLYQEWDGPNI